MRIFKCWFKTGGCWSRELGCLLMNGWYVDQVAQKQYQTRSHTGESRRYSFNSRQTRSAACVPDRMANVLMADFIFTGLYIQIPVAYRGS